MPGRSILGSPQKTSCIRRNWWDRKLRKLANIKADLGANSVVCICAIIILVLSSSMCQNCLSRPPWNNCPEMVNSSWPWKVFSKLEWPSWLPRIALFSLELKFVLPLELGHCRDGTNIPLLVRLSSLTTRNAFTCCWEDPIRIEILTLGNDSVKVVRIFTILCRMSGPLSPKVKRALQISFLDGSYVSSTDFESWLGHHG